MNFIDIHTHNIFLDTKIKYIRSIHLKEFNFEESKDELISVGIHPWFIPPKKIEEELMTLEKICQQSNVVAIGECGLDRYFTKNVKEFNKQLIVFNEHCRIANKLSKPLIIHAVNAYSDFMQWLKADKFKTKMIFHGFNGNEEIVDNLMKYNCWFSFGDSLLYSKKSIDIFKYIPLERCFLETDETTVSIETVYQIAAEIKQLDLNILQEKFQNNFEKCFNV